MSPNRTCSTQYQPERFHANRPNGLLPIKQRANGFTVRGATVISARALFNHAARILVFAQSNKLRVSQMIAFGPFQEFNLCHEFRIDPNTSVYKRRLLSF